MSVPFKALKVGQRYSFTDLETGKVDTGRLLKKYVVGGREESLIISLDASGEGVQTSAPYSLYNIKSLEPEAREAIREREKEKRDGEVEKKGSGRKRKTRKGKKSRKTLKKTQSRKHRKRGGANCSGI
jgi:hypothetical protein